MYVQHSLHHLHCTWSNEWIFSKSIKTRAKNKTTDEQLRFICIRCAFTQCSGSHIFLFLFSSLFVVFAVPINHPSLFYETKLLISCRFQQQQQQIIYNYNWICFQGIFDFVALHKNQYSQSLRISQFGNAVAIFNLFFHSIYSKSKLTKFYFPFSSFHSSISQPNIHSFSIFFFFSTFQTIWHQMQWLWLRYCAIGISQKATG